MTPIEAKEKLKKDGYTWFNIKEFDEKFYDSLLPLKCNEDENLKKYCSFVRLDSKNFYVDKTKNLETTKVFINEDFGTFENANKKITEILKNYKDTGFFQIWYYCDFNTLLQLKSQETKNIFDGIKNVVSYLYDKPKEQQYALLPNFTYYDIGCVLQNHSDGTGTGRVCAVLIYLNETYDEKDGGILVLNDTEKVIPTFGNIAIIDLQSFDIPHMVTEVIGGIGRYAILTFVKLKENEFKDK